MTGKPTETRDGRSPHHPHTHHVLVDDHDDDWAWRRAIRSNPVLATPYRVLVFVLGLVLVVGGLIMVPLPGPGWLVVIAGVALWATEFVFAQRVLTWLKRQLHTWTSWTARQPWWLKALVALLTFAFVAAVLWTMLKVMGIPKVVPDTIEMWMIAHLRL